MISKKSRLGIILVAMTLLLFTGSRAEAKGGTLITVNQMVSGTIANSEDVKIYQFDLAKAGKVSFAFI